MESLDYQGPYSPKRATEAEKDERNKSCIVISSALFIYPKNTRPSPRQRMCILKQWRSTGCKEIRGEITEEEQNTLQE